MTAKLPETLNLDRTPTPIGTALVVTDEAGVLRAFNWTDYEPAMRKWIGRRYPKARLVEGQGPLRAAFDAYFAGQTDAFRDIAWDGAGTAFQKQGLGRAVLHPVRRDLDLRPARRPHRAAHGRSRRGPGQRVESGRPGGALS